MRDLHLNLKAEYFDAIKAGTKIFEYRRRTPFWKRIIDGKQFDRVLIKCGYPKRDDADRILVRKWDGYRIETITHPHFGPEPVEVYAIVVNLHMPL